MKSIINTIKPFVFKPHNKFGHFGNPSLLFSRTLQPQHVQGLFRPQKLSYESINLQ